jgi:large conductance mechanosensitive channel
MIKKFMNEFKDFALRGNVMSLAVGVIIGSSFQGVVTSLTTNILSPVIGLFTRQNFDSLEFHVLGTSLQYGAFITAVVNFIIMAFVVFMLVRAMNRLLHIGDKKEEPAPEVPARLCTYCKTALHPEATRCPACTSQLQAA